MISRHVILLSTTVLLIQQSEANSDKHFLTLSAECGEAGNTANLTLHTSEPFFGLLYSRDHPSTCKSVGEGLTATQLVIDEKKKCGLELMEKRQRNLLVAAASSDQENMVEDPEVHQVSLYVQHDEHVQQVIDEQFLVQCWPGMRQGLVSYQDGLSNFVDKTLTRSISSFSTAATMIGSKSEDNNDGKLQRRLLDMVPMEPMTQTPDQGDLKQTSNMKDLVTLGGGEENSIDIGTPWTYPRSEEMITNRPNLLKAAASGWMELINAESGETLTESVQVGTPVSLVIRLKQMGKMDTMVSTCTAHSGDDFYDLTNFLGCTEDAEILPNFKAFFNSRTGVKRLTSTFPMFKFPDLNKVVVRCTIMVCNKNCPVSKCEDRRKIDFKEVDIVDKFYLDTFAEVHDSDGTHHHKREKFQYKDDDQIMRPLRPAEEDVSSESNYHKSQQEVEAVAASSVSKEETLNEEKDEDLLCLSPSRLALAFGILLVILLVALLASCTMWMRARSHSKRPKPSAFFTTRPPRPPGAAIVPANAPRGPFVVSRAPYIRVVQ